MATTMIAFGSDVIHQYSIPFGGAHLAVVGPCVAFKVHVATLCFDDDTDVHFGKQGATEPIGVRLMGMQMPLGLFPK